MTAALMLPVGVVLILAAFVVSRRTLSWAPFVARLLPDQWWFKDRAAVRRASEQQVDGLAVFLFFLGAVCTLAGIAGLIAMV